MPPLALARDPLPAQAGPSLSPHPRMPLSVLWPILGLVPVSVPWPAQDSTPAPESVL